jgi:hypothetical protein
MLVHFLFQNARSEEGLAVDQEVVTGRGQGQGAGTGRVGMVEENTDQGGNYR